MNEYSSYVSSLKARAKISRNGGCGKPEESDRSLSVLLDAQAELMKYVRENMLTRQDAETLFEIHSHSCPGSAHNAGAKSVEKIKDPAAKTDQTKKSSEIEVSRNGIRGEGWGVLIIGLIIVIGLIVFAPHIVEWVSSWKLK